MLRSKFLMHALSLSGFLGYPVAQALALLHRAEFWQEKDLAVHQNQALNKLMHHCYNHVPYYRSVMQKRGLVPDDFQTVDDLGRLPHLTRSIIREQGQQLRADNYPGSKCQIRRSGGTTGEPIQVATDVRARAFEVAAYLRGFEWMNYRFGEPMIRLFGGSLGLSEVKNLKSRLREWAFNTRFLPAFELTPENASDYVRVINETGEAVLVGYASAVRNLAEWVTSQQLQIDSLKSVICTAEYMPEDWRKYIGQALDAPVFCYYGCGEINSIAYECADEEGYLVAQEHIILEAANSDPNQFCAYGQGEACITTLYNYAMPLLRYRNGDMLTLKRPNHGRSHCRITDLEGRIVDQLVRQNGYQISGALIPHMVYKSGFPAWKYQLIQTDYDQIRFHYLLNSEDSLIENQKQRLVSILQHHLGQELTVQFVLGEFELPPSQKHRFVINKIPS